MENLTFKKKNDNDQFLKEQIDEIVKFTIDKLEEKKTVIMSNIGYGVSPDNEYINSKPVKLSEEDREKRIRDYLNKRNLDEDNLPAQINLTIIK